jgi:GNAT superfamily N-acetyltransferase
MDPAERLERSQWDFFWAPEDVTLHDRPELLYASCPRDLNYLNAVTRTDPEYPDLDALVGEVTRAHSHVHSRWAVPHRIATGRLHRALRAGGYEADQEHHARAVAVDAFQPRPSAACEVVQVSTLQHLRDLVTVGNAAFGHDRKPTDAQLRVDLAQCTQPAGRVRRFVAYANGRPVSGGGVNAFDDLQLGFLWAGATIPEARGQGFYSAVVAKRIDWAMARGLAWVGLYAVTTTSSPIVERQGFDSYGSMTYWKRDPATPPRSAP